MHKIRVYVDTSVFGGTCDEQFAKPSQRFFGRVRSGQFVVLVSRMVLREIRSAPEKVRQVLTDLMPKFVYYIEDNDEIDVLANAYLDAGILGPASRDDAMHIAAATVAGANLVLSWNFKHIVNYDRIQKYNAVNLLNGYQQIEIHSPMEMAYDNNDQSI